MRVRDSSGNFFAPKGKKIATNSPTRRGTPKNGFPFAYNYTKKNMQNFD
jgi:hypothetical protein